MFRLRRSDSRHRLLHTATILIFFWVIFDGILSYLVPILITERGFTDTQLGLIMAFSSVAGGTADFLLSRFLKNTNYLKTFFLLLAVSFFFPLVLWYSSHILVYLLAMAIWGVYFDLYNFAAYDFVSRNSTDSTGRADSFGFIELFRSLGGLLAPLVAAWMIIDRVSFSNVATSLLFLVVAQMFYLILFIRSPLHHLRQETHQLRTTNFVAEIRRWRGVGLILLPVLIFMVCMQVSDAVFWTIGPLFSESFPSFPHFSGFLMVIYNLPSLFTAWKVGALTDRFGKKRTAYFSLLLASLLLVPLGYLHSPYLVLFFVLLSSISLSFTWPAIEAAVADYISESSVYEFEIEGLTDFTANVGYIIGPVLAGFLADKIGISHAFSFLGAAVFTIITVLFFITPRHINVVLHRRP